MQAPNSKQQSDISHKVLLNKLIFELRAVNEITASTFSSDFLELKRMRVQADYKNICHPEGAEIKALNLSCKIINLLKVTFP